jgi:hypothetical protein
MSSKTIDGIRFNAYSNDHDPPHIDAEVDGMKMKFVFETEEDPPYPKTKNPHIKAQDAKRAFQVFRDNQGTLRAMFNKVQNAKKN